MRVFIGPTEVSGLGTALKSGFDQIGVDSDLVLSQPHIFGYSADGQKRPPLLARVWQGIWSAQARAGRKGSPLGKAILFVWKAWSLLILLWALWRFDRFIFLFGNTITNTALEPWLLAKFRKRVVVLFCGSDARPPYVDGWFVHLPSPPSPETIAREALRRKRRIRQLEQNHIICANSPFTGHFHERPYVSSFALGVPRNTNGISAEPRAKQGTIRALHSPSNPKAKGTQAIEAAIYQLREEGLDIELAVISGVSNHLVMAEIAKSDFVIDQLYSDTPLAAFAIEAATCGRPTIVCGYSASEGLADIIRAPVPPSLYATPDRLTDAIRKMATDTRFRDDLGAKARQFVLDAWSPPVVARRFLAVLDAGAPSEWLIEPGRTIYVQGAGLSEAEGRRTVSALVSSFGPSALALDDRPEFRQAFLDFGRDREADSRP